MGDASYKIDQGSADRLDRVIRQVLGTGERTAGNPQVLRQPETCWGKLTTKVDDGWEWVEVSRKNDGGTISYEVIEGGRSGDDSLPEAEKSLAIEVQPGSGVADKIVLLRRIATEKPGEDEDDDPAWISGWAIIPGGGGLVRLKCTDSLGGASATVLAKRWDGTFMTGDDVIVILSYHTAVGSDFYAVTDGTEYKQIGLPTNVNAFVHLQTMDTTGGPQALDLDYLKGHA